MAAWATPPDGLHPPLGRHRVWGAMRGHRAWEGPGETGARSGPSESMEERGVRRRPAGHGGPGAPDWAGGGAGREGALPALGRLRDGLLPGLCAEGAFLVAAARRERGRGEEGSCPADRRGVVADLSVVAGASGGVAASAPGRVARVAGTMLWSGGEAALLAGGTMGGGRKRRHAGRRDVEGGRRRGWVGSRSGSILEAVAGAGRSRLPRTGAGRPEGRERA